MVIEKNSSKVALIDPEFHSPHSRDTIMSSEYDEDVHRRNLASAFESDDDDDDGFDDSDSGAGSDDDFDLLDLGESGEEFCQIGDQTCSVPYELYDLPGLKDVLSLEVWNDVLTEEDRLHLSKYLPDMDQENYVHTLKQLFSGDNLLFGSPISKLFEMLKGGMCEPRVALYRQGLNFFQKRQHYHNLRKYHNTMVNNLHQVRDAWMNCRGHSITEKLHMWNMIKSQNNDAVEPFISDPYDKDESGDGLWDNRLKDRKLGQKKCQYSAFRINPRLDIPSHGQKSTPEPTLKHGKRNSKRNSKLENLKIAPAKGIDESLPSTLLGVPLRSHRYGSSATLTANEGILEDDESESFCHSFMRSSTSGRINVLGRNKTINKLSDITMLTVKPVKASGLKSINGGGKNVKHDEDLQQIASGNQMKHAKGRKSNAFAKEKVALLDAEDPTWLRQHAEFFPTNFPGNSKKFTTKSKQWDNGNEFCDGFGKRGMGTFLRNDDTESDSTEHVAEGEDDNSLMRNNMTYPSGVPELNRDPDVKKLKLSKKDKRAKYSNLHGSAHLLRKRKYLSEPGGVNPETREKVPDTRFFTNLTTKELSEHQLTGLGNIVGGDDQKKFYSMGSNGYSDADGFRMPSQKYSVNQGKRRKGPVAVDSSLPQSSQVHESFEHDFLTTQLLSLDNGSPFKLGKRNQFVSDGYHPERPELSLVGSDSLRKKWKLKHGHDLLDPEYNDGEPESAAEVQLENIRSIKKRGKVKLNDKLDMPENGVSQPLNMELEMEDIEPAPRRTRKTFPLITPTVPCNFSFSIIHLLSAVRVAMVTMLPDDSDGGKHNSKNGSEEGVKEEEQACKPDGTSVDMDPNTDVSTPAIQANVPSLSVLDIINRVRSNPGDPCILETQEPLQDLIRGVLKIFSARTAPLGAKGWKPLVAYDKSKKGWSWIGPVSSSSSEHEPPEEVTSPDAWGLPHKMLVKLVDSFANWLKNSQETLKQIGSLPSPPLMAMQMNLDEKERYKDLRAQKSLSTINPSTEEVRAYFRKEEELRYQIPDRAFSYTAIDGKKSIVAPLRRCGGKPTSKARDHFMLKPDRPPHVTILCLVRDAASRLPGSTGTRADVCILIRDSQYVVEDVSDTQVNQVVSGALDRLHYERDPCVQFDSDKKLWVYLHREREEEDFEDDGTSSTKKWKRQSKKDGTEPLEPGDVTVDYTENPGQSAPDFVSDLNPEASLADVDKRSEHGDQNGENIAENTHVPDYNITPFPASVMWDYPGHNMSNETGGKLFIQEMSTTEAFDDDALGDPPPT